MEIHEKISLMRHAKKWSQEEMADKLGMSVNGYANLEHGNTDLQLSRLNQIAKVFEVDLLELFNFGERGILCFVGNGNNYQGNNYLTNGQQSTFNSSDETKEFKHEIEKLHLILEKKEQEIKYLKEMLDLMKSNSDKK